MMVATDCNVKAAHAASKRNDLQKSPEEDGLNMLPAKAGGRRHGLHLPWLVSVSVTPASKTSGLLPKGGTNLILRKH